jgi:uncharacterized protein (TIGR03067 family)
MIRRAALVVLLVHCSTPFAAPIPKELKQGDQALILGTWKLVESGSGTNALRPGDGSCWRFDADGKAAIVRANGKADEGIRYTIDPRESPKQFDWMPSWGNYRGCYTLEGDRLTLYLRNGDHDNRVKEAKQAANVEVYSFERVK